VPSLHINTPPLFQTELEKDSCESADVLWCHGAKNIRFSNHYVKSALTCTVWSQWATSLFGSVFRSVQNLDWAKVKPKSEVHFFCSGSVRTSDWAKDWAIRLVWSSDWVQS